MDNLKVGDVLISKWGEEETVFQITGKIIFTTDDDEKTDFYSLDELKEEGFSLKEAPKEMTVQQVAEALGHEVKIVKS